MGRGPPPRPRTRLLLWTRAFPGDRGHTRAFCGTGGSRQHPQAPPGSPLDLGFATVSTLHRPLPLCPPRPLAPPPLQVLESALRRIPSLPCSGTGLGTPMRTVPVTAPTQEPFGVTGWGASVLNTAPSPGSQQHPTPAPQPTGGSGALLVRMNSRSSLQERDKQKHVETCQSPRMQMWHSKCHRSSLRTDRRGSQQLKCYHPPSWVWGLLTWTRSERPSGLPSPRRQAPQQHFPSPSAVTRKDSTKAGHAAVLPLGRAQRVRPCPPQEGQHQSRPRSSAPTRTSPASPAPSPSHKLLALYLCLSLHWTGNSRKQWRHPEMYHCISPASHVAHRYSTSSLPIR